MNVLSKSIKTIAEALARHIFNLSLVVSLLTEREGGRRGGERVSLLTEREGGGERERGEGVSDVQCHSAGSRWDSRIVCWRQRKRSHMICFHDSKIPPPPPPPPPPTVPRCRLHKLPDEVIVLTTSLSPAASQWQPSSGLPGAGTATAMVTRGCIANLCFCLSYTVAMVIQRPSPSIPMS